MCCSRILKYPKLDDQSGRHAVESGCVIIKIIAIKRYESSNSHIKCCEKHLVLDLALGLPDVVKPGKT